MYSFQNDYSEGAHPRILECLMKTNLVQQVGYGEDKYCAEAKELIRQQINNPNAEIYFISGGTQANLLVISAVLRVHEGVICAETGHIFEHECGAIEATGHRVITVPCSDGKITVNALKEVLKNYDMRPHVLKPKMVYLSNSTEVGTIYTKKELAEILAFCRANNLYLFMDGARLGAALTAQKNDLTLSEIAQLTDIFYIGGTKNGALLGEAVIFNRPDIAPEFDYSVKQKGAMLAKGRLLGIQFLVLFRNGLFFELAQHANDLAAKIQAKLEAHFIEFWATPETNQLFPILSRAQLERLSKNYLFNSIKTLEDNKIVIRLVTSWAMQEEDILKFVADLDAIL